MPDHPRPFARLSFSLEPAVGADELGQLVRIQVDDAQGEREVTAFVPEGRIENEREMEVEHYPGGPCPDCPDDEGEA